MQLFVRIVSYNVRYFGHALRGLASTRAPKERIADKLLSLDPLPDVVCLQEVETVSLRSNVAYRRTNNQHTQLQSFMAVLEERFAQAGREMPYEAYYFRAHTYQLRSVPIYTTGLAVLVNSQAVEVEGHNVHAPEHITHHHVQRLKDTKQSRVCAHMRLSDLRGHRFHVFNTHMSLPTPFAKEFWAGKDKMGWGINQLHEARTLAQFVRRHANNEPFIVCGDFNSAPSSPTFRFLTEEQSLVCAQSALGQIDPEEPRGFPTAGFLHLRMHLDHLFSGGGVRWVDLQGTRPFGDVASPFHGLSDHVPLIGRFELDG
ncbi:MAG: endonuclease/exonuclease/phosphatase family protein [Myxococcaceae bacterium]